MYASVIPFAICRFGKVATTLGSNKENFGKANGPPIVRFSFNSDREITAPEFISDPVAGSVSTVPNGIASVKAYPSFRSKTSHGSPL